MSIINKGEMNMNRRLKARIIEVFGTQADFAQKAGVDDSYVSKIVRGRRYLPEKEATRWAELLKCGTEVFKND
jgi:plasmid maintenance system antidote protein VapI